MSYLIATFYKFVTISNPEAVRAQILTWCQQQIKGTIILAEEGINGTIAGSSDAIANIFDPST